MELIRKHTFKRFDTNDPSSIILHIDLGTEMGTTEWILNGPKSISYNYYITHGGEVIEFVPYYKGAWHSGVVFEPTQEAKSFFGNVNPNKKSVGICYEGRTTTTAPNAKQIAACKELIAFLESKITIKKIFIHREITAYKPAIVQKMKDAVTSEEKEHTICPILRKFFGKYGCKGQLS